MKILAIESSTHRGSIALVEEGSAIAEKTVTKNSEELALSVDAILNESATDKNEIGLIAVSSGPGFFSSLKIGAAMAKSFAYALKIPIAAVPSLEILASSADCPPGGAVCAAINARSGMFFWALFKKHGERSTRLSEDAVTKAGEIEKHLAGLEADSLTAVLQEDGSGEKPELPNFKVQNSRASVCAALGLQRMDEGKTETAFSFAPNYMREDLFSGT